ncbi:MAG TPA: hypothetical protein VLS44_04690 [Nitrospira sp.]|nr:hypothetical protein [Nitrospira sp.]
MTTPANPPPPTGFHVDRGTCFVLFAYDIARSVDLNRAERRITAITERSRLKHKRRAPAYFDYTPAPLRITADIEPIAIGQHRTGPVVDMLLYDFGAVCVSYSLPLQGPFSSLGRLSQDLYENEALLSDSRRRIEELLTGLGDAAERPHIADFVEDYVIVHIEQTTPSLAPDTLLTGFAQPLAQLLRSETLELAEQEVHDSVSQRISFGSDDVAIIDWNATLIYGRNMEDVVAVIEFANVELLEMRFLDQQLDLALDQAYHASSKRRWDLPWFPGTARTDVRRIAQLQVDSAILFEQVTNTLKLFGDQYLARVHRLISQRFHLESWDASISRKLHTLDSIYGKMTESAASWRMELLEWIIIVLIAISIAVSFLPGLTGH